MRRVWISTVVLAVIGLIFGALFRYFNDPANEISLANYLRSSFHGAGIGMSGWSVHLYFTSRRAAWVRRWPLAI